ncbi:MAG: precorrin-8X methylmutase [Alphaproteobacteria bacterium]
MAQTTHRPHLSYERDPAAIYQESFAIARAETDLGVVPKALAPLVMRLVHAAADPELAPLIIASPNAFAAGRRALQGGATIFTDCEMVRAGITRRFLPAANRVICTLGTSETAERAAAAGTTRSAAAVDFWDARLAGAVVAIGNAPTTLFHLLERLDQGAPVPALIIGLPIGFVGAAQAKAALAQNPRGADFVTLEGRRGGSPLAAAAVNALAVGDFPPALGEFS